MKINQIVKVFEDAYRSKEACIIIDNLERLLEFIDLGPRFSNDMLQTLLILLKRPPKKPDSRLLIIGTTSSFFKLIDTGLPHAFNVRLQVPQLN
jgi:vesicle-fusing ATPase